MGFGKMTVPLHVSPLPKGMTLTIDEIIPSTPAGMYTHVGFAYNISLPHTFTAEETLDGQKTNDRGAKIADLYMQCDSGWESGSGGSFLIKFTMNGRPDEYPDAELLDNRKGELTVGTSQWGRVYRPDQSIFTWTIDGRSGTYSASTPTWAPLDDSCMALGWSPEYKVYIFSVSNQQYVWSKLAQYGVSGIAAGHKVGYSVVAGMISPFGGAVVGIVAFGGDLLNKI